MNNADQPTRPISPQLILYVLLGAFLGGTLGAMIAAAILLTENNLVSVRQIESQIGIPCLAVFPKSGDTRKGSLTDVSDFPPGLGFLCSHFLARSKSNNMQVIGFCPADANQRFSRVVVDLAILLAQAGKKTVVVDLHFEKLMIAKMLGIEVKNGMEQWIHSEQPISDFLSYSAISELAVFSPIKSDPALEDFISRRPLSLAWESLSSSWDFVLIDAPSILSDWSLSLSLPAESVLILQADFYKTKLDQLRQACFHARGPNWEVGGIVLTNAPDRMVL